VERESEGENRLNGHLGGWPVAQACVCVCIVHDILTRAIVVTLQ